MTNKKPLIGITASLLTVETGSFFGRERSFVGYDYVKAVSAAGGTAILLPVVGDEETIKAHVDLVDAIILSGGYDVTPQLYGEEPKPFLEATHPLRDAFEISITQHAYKKHKPILGICRGVQLLNVAFGGTLYQDVSQHGRSVLQHNQHCKPEYPSHTVIIEEDTLLAKIQGKTEISTNSYHHQAVKDVAPGFIVNARTKDGLIEGIESIGSHFILGVQWHPELMFEKNSDMFALFKGFIDIVRQSKK